MITTNESSACDRVADKLIVDRGYYHDKTVACCRRAASSRSSPEARPTTAQLRRTENTLASRTMPEPAAIAAVACAHSPPGAVSQRLKAYAPARHPDTLATRERRAVPRRAAGR
jgi:hypothetical protein